MSPVEWLTLIAIIVGPIAAVSITLWRDRRYEVRRRKREILASLMRTRSSRLSAEHVGALNLVQLEFHGSSAIIEAYKQYIEHLGTPLPAVDQQDSFFQQRETRFLDLLKAIAVDLGYKFDKKDLESLSYSPRGWHDYESMQRGNMLLLWQLLKGERALRVKNEITEEHGPFPPPPA